MNFKFIFLFVLFTLMCARCSGASDGTTTVTTSTVGSIATQAIVTTSTTTEPITTTTTTAQATTMTTTTTVTTTTTPIPFLTLTGSYAKPVSQIILSSQTNLKQGSSITYECVNSNNMVTTVNESLPNIESIILIIINVKNSSYGTEYTCAVKIDSIVSNSVQIKIDLSTVTDFSFTSPSSNSLSVSYTRPTGVYDSLTLICSAELDVNSKLFNVNQLSFIKTLLSTDSQTQQYKFTNDIITGLQYDCFFETIKMGFVDQRSVRKSILIKPGTIQFDAKYNSTMNSIDSSLILQATSYYSTISVKQNNDVKKVYSNITSRQLSLTMPLSRTGSFVYNLTASVLHDGVALFDTDLRQIITPPRTVENLSIQQSGSKNFTLFWSLLDKSDFEHYFKVTNENQDQVYCANLTVAQCSFTIRDAYLLNDYRFRVETSISNGTQSIMSSYTTISYSVMPTIEGLTFQTYKKPGVSLSYGCLLNWSIRKPVIEQYTNATQLGLRYSLHGAATIGDYLDLSYCTNPFNSTVISCQRVFEPLTANTRYFIDTVVSKFDRNSSVSRANGSCQTDIATPTDLNSTRNIAISKSATAIQFTQPDIDQSTGRINGYWIYLFDQGTQSLNESDMDARFIEALIRNMTNCSFGLCPIDTEQRAYTAGKLIKVGPFSDMSTETEELFEFKIKPSTSYGLFMLYSIKVAQSPVNSKRAIVSYTSDSQMYFVSRINSFMSANDLSKSVSNLETWIIAIVIVAVVLLLAIVIITGVITYRRWPANLKPMDFLRAASLTKKQRQQQKQRLQEQASHNQLNTIVSDIRVAEMSTVWLYKHANDDLKFEDEFKDLPDYRDVKTSNAGFLNENKNRFLDIKPYDDSRVLLENHPTSNDYINANFIQGYNGAKKFIATQGPLKHTIVDFWHMVYQYRVHAIIMLTNIIEKGMERCAVYWPEHLHVAVRYGHIEVAMRECQKYGEYVKRVFDVCLVNDATATATTRSHILCVTQYYYPEWPDKDTPTTDPMSVLHLIRDVNKAHPPHQHPIIVHCSAGVGRTGTYITLDAMCEQIIGEQKLNVFTFIKKIREQRQYLVQTCKQYVFIHEALYEYCLYGFTDIEANKLKVHYQHLKETPSNSNKSRLHAEFEKLNTAYMHQSQSKEAFNHANKSRNRNLDYVCYDENRVKLSSLNGSSYINATKIQGYESNMFIITQDPLPNTIFDFWKMISEYNCQIVVCLNRDWQFDEKCVYWPTDDEPTRIFEFEDLKFCVSLVNPSEQEDLSESINRNSSVILRKEYEIIEHKYNSTHKFRITQFVFNEQWTENQVPKNHAVFVDLIGQVQKLYCKLDKSPIVVHANAGGSNCSVFCALSILIEQVKADQYVDVCRTVKKLKCQRSHMIESFEQYNFLYECLVEFVGMFGILSCQTSFDRFSNSSLMSSQMYPNNS